jgi:hypothetical protein
MTVCLRQLFTTTTTMECVEVRNDFLFMDRLGIFLRLSNGRYPHVSHQQLERVPGLCIRRMIPQAWAGGAALPLLASGIIR